MNETVKMNNVIELQGMMNVIAKMKHVIVRFAERQWM